jgi:translation initiation factor IF-1
VSGALEGVVETELPRGLYTVRSDDGRRFTAAMPVERRHGVVKLTRGDRVRIEPSASDAQRARIVAKL